MQIRNRISETLEFGPQIDISLEPSRRFLYRHIDKKVKLIILIIDIADSTKLSLSINTNILARMIQLFAQEMSLIANLYGGYVLKYVGDSVIAFFPAEFDEKKACMNAIAASKDMLKVIDEHINPELAKRSYPKIRAKVSINLGSDLVVAYDKEQSYIDIVGSTISVAAKILLNTPHSSIIVTRSVYEQVDKRLFEEIQLDDMLVYKLVNTEDLKRYFDGKAIVYRAIDEVDLNNPSAIKEILRLAIKEGYDKDTYQTIIIALMHFMLSKFMIPSERKVEVNNQILDIVIPSSRVLRRDPDNALILAFPDDKFDADKLAKLQPNKDNIWLIFGYPITRQYDYRVYLPDQFNGRPLSSIIDDINDFLKKRNVEGFKILPS